jgi:uncharacterized protein
MARFVTVRDAESGQEVCPRCELADTFWSRLRGLQLRASLEPGHGLLLRPGGSIHMFFMRFPIDAVFLDADLRVMEVRENLRPWRTAACRGAKAVLELPTGAAAQAGVVPGRRLAVEELA